MHIHDITALSRGTPSFVARGLYPPEWLDPTRVLSKDQPAAAPVPASCSVRLGAAKRISAAAKASIRRRNAWRCKFTATPIRPTYLQRQALRRLIDAFGAAEIRFAAPNVTVQLTSAAA